MLLLLHTAITKKISGRVITKQFTNSTQRNSASVHAAVTVTPATLESDIQYSTTY